MHDLLNDSLSRANGRPAAHGVRQVKPDPEPRDSDLPSNIFRLTRRFKGARDFLDLPRLEAVAHAGGGVSGKAPEGGIESDAKAAESGPAATQTPEHRPI